ncbi:MAG: hypothetical protein JST76_08285, partial [Bacteroidetes bacterium]|nr:hypothetical protein [Bacteroidota bacterium]
IMSYYLIDSTTGKSILNKFWYDTSKIFTPYYANEKQIEGLSGAALGTNYLNVPDFSKHLLISKETFTDKDSLSSQTNFSYARAENGAVSVIGKTYWDIWIGEQIVNHNLRLKKE